MAANTAPRYTLTANIGVGKKVATGDATTDGTGTTVLIFTAGATGSRVSKVRFTTLGSNVASNGRIYINNGSTPGTAGNNSLIAEVALPATTITQIAGQTPVDVVLDIDLPTTYRLYAQVGTTVAAGWIATPLGGDF